MRIRTSKFGGFFARIRVFAVVAQLVEQHIRNVKVPSSIPGNGTKLSNEIKWLHASACSHFFFSTLLSWPCNRYVTGRAQRSLCERLAFLQLGLLPHLSTSTMDQNLLS